MSAGHHIIESIKKHPYMTAAIVAAVGGLYLISGGASNTSSSTSGPSDSTQQAEINAASQVYTAQAQAQLQNNQLVAATTVAQQQIAAQVDQTNSNNATSIANNQIAAQVADNANLLTSQTQLGVSTIQAQIQGQAIQAQTDQAQISSNTTTTLGAQNVENTYNIVNAATQQAQIASNTAVEQSKLLADAYNNNGLFSFIGKLVGGGGIPSFLEQSIGNLSAFG